MRNKPKYLLVLLLTIAGGKSFAQDIDSLNLLGNEKSQKELVTRTFKSPRIIMAHSVEMLHPGVLDFRILHRFGTVNNGISDFYGLDEASMRLGLDYGLTNNLTVGIGRSTYRKEIDGFLKYRPIQQATGAKASPISVVLVGGATVITTKWTDTAHPDEFVNRLAYYGQILIARKFTEALSIQLTPTILHRNLVDTKDDPNDMYAVGFGGRIKLSKRVSFNVDYFYVINQNKNLLVYNPLSFGFDIETGGHVFQLHFTNAVGMNERAILTETTNDWGQGAFSFGFNISRSFQIKKKKG
jgi:hypothetical protein